MSMWDCIIWKEIYISECLVRTTRKGLTTIDNFAKYSGTVGGRAVPAAVAELPLALLYGSVQPSSYGMQNARVLANQPALASTQQGQAGVQDQLHVFGIGQEVGWGGHIDNTPGTTHKDKGIQTGRGWQFVHCIAICVIFYLKLMSWHLLFWNYGLYCKLQ